MRIAVLGTGLMGFGMARVLARAGFEVRAWNRSVGKARPLADDGALVVEQVEQAVEGAEVVITMLFDLDAVLDVMDRAHGRMAADAVWLQCSTVGPDGSAAIADFAREHALQVLDAPVLGTKKPAEDGQLVVLASGNPLLRAAAQPVFDAVGSRTVWAGDELGQASALKLVCNAWVLTITAGAAQSIALAQSLGVDPQLFLDSIAGTATDSAYAHVKGKAILGEELTASFPVDGGLKDLGLILAAAEAGIDTSIIASVQQAFQRAADRGHAQEDLAAVYYGIAQRIRRPPESA